jgi:hypothetical protein
VCVTKLCVKGCVCDKIVRERLCVTKLCERVVCDKFVCAKAAGKSSVCIRERWTDSLAAWMAPSTTPATQNGD